MKTIYQPTEAELIEMGFKGRKDDGKYWWFHSGIGYEINRGFFLNEKRLYPTSKSEILALIELFNQ